MWKTQSYEDVGLEKSMQLVCNTEIILQKFQTDKLATGSHCPKTFYLSNWESVAFVMKKSVVLVQMQIYYTFGAFGVCA